MFNRLALFLVLSWQTSFSQYGCTDIQASNYNPLASINDGSCTYPPTTLQLNLLTGLATPLLDESSGTAFINGQIWTHIDNINHSIFKIDSLSQSVLQQVTVNASTNIDWEDLATSNDYVFIGDFGNNYGNRTNLQIFKIAKADLTASALNVNAEVINFNYADQTDFTAHLNNNSFDCEAFIYYHDSLHLFTKDWVHKITKHYVLPATAGSYTAYLADSFNVNGLITSAAIQDSGLMVLLGYDNTGFGPCFIWMFNDYKANSFFSGNKRMFSIGSAAIAGQVEGIDFAGKNHGYLTNERFQKLSFNVPPQLKSFDLSGYLTSAFTNAEIVTTGRIIYKIFPVPFDHEINVVVSPFKKSTVYDFIITDMDGRTVLRKKLRDDTSIFSTDHMMPGIYTGKFYQNKKLSATLRFVKD